MPPGRILLAEVLSPSNEEVALADGAHASASTVFAIAAGGALIASILLIVLCINCVRSQKKPEEIAQASSPRASKSRVSVGNAQPLFIAADIDAGQSLSPAESESGLRLTGVQEITLEPTDDCPPFPLLRKPSSLPDLVVESTTTLRPRPSVSESTVQDHAEESSVPTHSQTTTFTGSVEHDHDTDADDTHDSVDEEAITDELSRVRTRSFLEAVGTRHGEGEHFQNTVRGRAESFLRAVSWKRKDKRQPVATRHNPPSSTESHSQTLSPSELEPESTYHHVPRRLRPQRASGRAKRQSVLRNAQGSYC